MLEEIKNEITPETTQEKMEAIASENFEIWNKALQNKDPKKMAEFYIENATFLPTLSEEFKKGQLGAEEYFKHFLEKNPIGEVSEKEVQIIRNDCYIHSGMYNFEVDSDNGRQVVEARFTFIWEKDNQGEWKIVHHHSSLKPNQS